MACFAFLATRKQLFSKKSGIIFKAKMSSSVLEPVLDSYFILERK